MLDRWYRAVDDTAAADNIPTEVMAALNDDLNIALAMSAMHALADKAIAGDIIAAAELRSAANIMGLLEGDAKIWFKGAAADDYVANVERAIADRVAARERHDYSLADRIRDKLKDQGIELEDRPDGTTDWRKVG